jgi:hypothetical protein
MPLPELAGGATDPLAGWLTGGAFLTGAGAVAGVFLTGAGAVAGALLAGAETGAGALLAGAGAGALLAGAGAGAGALLFLFVCAWTTPDDANSAAISAMANHPERLRLEVSTLFIRSLHLPTIGS